MSSEKSVSREAESARERTHEDSRKKTSVVRVLKSKSNDRFTRADQHATVVGLNSGSNRNAGRSHENESVPDRPMQYTPDQTERDHATMPVATEGSIPNRSVEKSGVAERHIRSAEGFKI